MLLMKDVPAALDAKFLVLSKLAELYARTGQDKHAKKMVAEGRRLSVDEERTAWLERFQLLDVNISCAFGRTAEGCALLVEVQAQAAAQGRPQVQLTCLVVQLQLAVTQLAWDAGEAKQMLVDGDALVAQLRAAGAGGDTEALDELCFMLEVMHVLYSTHTEDQASCGVSAESRLTKALAALADAKPPAAAEAAGQSYQLWLPRSLRGALLRLVAAGIHQSNDTSRALENVHAGTQTVDEWLEAAAILMPQGEQPARTCIGSQTLVGHTALRMKAGLAEIGFHALLTRCDFVGAADQLYKAKQLVISFGSTFRHEDVAGRHTYFTAEYAYCVGELQRAGELCDEALPLCQDSQIRNQCHVLKAVVLLEQDDLAGCLAALDTVAHPEDEKTVTIQASAAAQFAKALRNHLQGQYQPAKTLGMQTFTCSKSSNMQQTAQALCLLGEVYLALGAKETDQMLAIAIQTAGKTGDTLTNCIALTHLVKLANKSNDASKQEQADRSTVNLNKKMKDIDEAIAKAKVTWQHWGIMAESVVEPAATDSAAAAAAGSAAVSPSGESQAVQLLEYGTGSGVKKKPVVDRWAKSRGKQ